MAGGPPARIASDVTLGAEIREPRSALYCSPGPTLRRCGRPRAERRLTDRRSRAPADSKRPAGRRAAGARARPPTDWDPVTDTQAPAEPGRSPVTRTRRLPRRTLLRGLLLV